MCWQTPDGRFVGVVRGSSPEPTLLRSNLAERSAELVRDAMLDAWTRNPTGPVEAWLLGAFEAAHRRLQDEGRSVVELSPVQPRRRWPWQRRTEAPPAPPTPTVFQGTAQAAALVIEDDAVYIAHVGACRVFGGRTGEWSRLTRDHTLEADYADAGVSMSEVLMEYRSIVTRTLGLNKCVAPTITRHSLDDAPFLICTPNVGFPLDVDPPAVTWGDVESMLAAFEHSQGALVIVGTPSG